MENDYEIKIISKGSKTVTLKMSRELYDEAFGMEE